MKGPSEKERRYDRQLRLWAASGQNALESAHVLLVNSGSGNVGIETLKNLVLPGIGRFTIADSAVVTEGDLGTNFFLDETCLGLPRAECCAKRLLDLNPQVEGNWYPKTSPRPGVTTTGHKKLCLEGPPQMQVDLDLAEILDDSSNFTIILHTFPIREQDMVSVKSYARTHQTPVISIHSAGFYSYFHIDLPGVFPVVDTHPDETMINDLRLLNPWDELDTFCRELTENMESMDDDEHGHLPFVAILRFYLQRWRQGHENKYPHTYAEKVAFRGMVLAGMRRNNAEGGEENFEEAAAAVLKAVTSPSLPSSLREVFNYQHVSSGGTADSFWLIAGAMKKFYEKHGVLPLPGGIPDMKARSGVYVKMQSIYKSKAHADVTEVLGLVDQSRAESPVSRREVEAFCKNAAFVKLINKQAQTTNNVSIALDDEHVTSELSKHASIPGSLVPIYLALRAASHKANPTEDEILAAIEDIAPGADVQSSTRLVAQEVARAGAGELHNISALTGGMVAQEVIKIVTKQYVPIDNTCIYDGIESKSEVLRL